jgi:hypothetical protein
MLYVHCTVYITYRPVLLALEMTITTEGLLTSKHKGAGSRTGRTEVLEKGRITVVFDQGLNVHIFLDQERLVPKWLIKGLNVHSAWSGKKRTEEHGHGRRDVSKCFI